MIQYHYDTIIHMVYGMIHTGIIETHYNCLFIIWFHGRILWKSHKCVTLFCNQCFHFHFSCWLSPDDIHLYISNRSTKKWLIKKSYRKHLQWEINLLFSITKYNDLISVHSKYFTIHVINV